MAGVGRINYWELSNSAANRVTLDLPEIEKVIGAIMAIIIRGRQNILFGNFL